VAQAGDAFATPTIVHFGAVLLLAAILSAPWRDLAGVSLLWGLLGLSGMAYELIVARRMRKQIVYKPQFEDWLFHVLLPFAAYGILGASALTARTFTRDALFAIASASLLLLFIGIHNAWDGVTYHVFVNRPKHQKHAGEAE
jgi:hypothetical protein